MSKCMLVHVHVTCTVSHMKSCMEYVILGWLLCKAPALGIVCILSWPVAPSVFSSSGPFVHDKMAFLVEVIRQHQSQRDLVISKLWIKLSQTWALVCQRLTRSTCWCVCSRCVLLQLKKVKSLIRKESFRPKMDLSGRCVHLSHWCGLLATVQNKTHFSIFRGNLQVQNSWCWRVAR